MGWTNLWEMARQDGDPMRIYLRHRLGQGWTLVGLRRAGEGPAAHQWLRERLGGEVPTNCWDDDPPAHWEPWGLLLGEVLIRDPGIATLFKLTWG